MYLIYLIPFRLTSTLKLPRVTVPALHLVHCFVPLFSPPIDSYSLHSWNPCKFRPQLLGLESVLRVLYEVDMMFTYIKQLTQNTTVVDCVYGALEEVDALQPTLREKNSITLYTKFKTKTTWIHGLKCNHLKLAWDKLIELIKKCPNPLYNLTNKV